MSAIQVLSARHNTVDAKPGIVVVIRKKRRVMPSRPAHRADRAYRSQHALHLRAEQVDTVSRDLDVITTARRQGRHPATWSAQVASATATFAGLTPAARNTRRGRNLDSNPHVVVHLESATDVVIVEGSVEKLDGTNSEPELLRSVDAADVARYQMPHGTPVWGLTATRALAWTAQLTDATRSAGLARDRT